MENDTPRTPYRVFVSYSHDDRKLADEVAKILEDQKLVAFYDQMIRPGSAFSDEIKGLISHSHIFMPLLTENSHARPWVHQEIGYAMALNIPVLPVTTDGTTSEMLATFHAIRIEEGNLATLADQLEEMNLDQFVRPKPQRLSSLVEVADWPEKRAETLANAARRVIEIGYHGRIFQRGGLSSFSIPDRDPEDEIWNRRGGEKPRGGFYNYCLRDERRYLELHARKCGCKLFINPAVATSGNTPSARACRLETLLDFLESMPDDKVSIVCNSRATEANITIIEDWVFSESRSRFQKQGWRQTIFNWHAPTVLRAQREFKNVFESFLAEDAHPGKSSRVAAIEQLNNELKKI